MCELRDWLYQKYWQEYTGSKIDQILYSLHFETPYVNNQKHGVEKSYYQDGSLYCESPYVNNQRHGVRKYYYPNGLLFSETPYVNNQKHGVEKYYHKDGSLDFEIHYYNEEQVEDFEQVRLLDKFSKW